MKRNMSKFDRIIRMTLALFLILLCLSNYIIGTWAVVSVLIALILFFTALYGYCPLYTLLKISTNKK